MDKIKRNGNGKMMNASVPEGGTIDFPVTFDLKAVMHGTVSDADNKERLVVVFDKLLVTHSFRRKKLSSKGTYVSFTYNVTLTSKQQMDLLYDALKRVEGLKFAL